MGQKLESLKAEGVVTTLEQLELRMAERFPHEGLKGLCASLAVTARTTAKRARKLGRPYLFLRMTVLGVIGVALALQLWLVSRLEWSKVDLGRDAVDVSQGLDSTVNLFILTGGAAWFLLGLEARLKRSRALAALHELRGFAHVVDMYQLTKDPTVALNPDAAATASSPKRVLSPFELTRYLEYCVELLALTGKLAALFGEHTSDPDMINAVADVEDLTNQLSLKIWQKIAILEMPHETF